jgi:hypothetical protein
LRDRDNRSDLFERLGGAELLAEGRVRTATVAPASSDHLPLSFTRLDRLRPDHHARTQLAALGHDPDRLARVFGVGYCPAADVRVADERVVAPVRRGQKLVGWLAVRFVGAGLEFLAAPGLAAAKELYNLDRAKEYPAAVVVPSPDWVWRVGTAATAPLSSSDPERLAGLLRKALPGIDLVLVSTAGHHAAVRALADELASRHWARVAHVRLPAKAVTASRVELRRMLRVAAT